MFFRENLYQLGICNERSVFFPTGTGVELSSRCVEYGIDYHGNDVEVLRNINLAHWSDCAKQCRDHSACSYWTFKVADNICALKSSDAGWEKQDNAMSGSSDCLSEC